LTSFNGRKGGHLTVVIADDDIIVEDRSTTTNTTTNTRSILLTMHNKFCGNLSLEIPSTLLTKVILLS
jgi:hypothetical protein